MITEKHNPVAERAALRRQQWEAQQPGFWTKPRFDLIDLTAIVLTLTGSLTLLFILH